MSAQTVVCLRRGLFAKGLSTLLICSLIQLIVLSSHAHVARAQGLSSQKLELFPRIPPVTFLSDRDPILKFNSQTSVAYDLLQRTRKTLEDFLRKQAFYSDSSANGQIEIDCTITNLEASQKNVRLWRSQYQRTGSRMETDNDTGMTRTVDEYGYVNVDYDGVGVDARINLNYEMKDSLTGIVLDSGMISTGFYQEYDSQSLPDINSVHGELLAKATNELSARFASPVYKLDVLLPKGKLKNASNLLEKRLWTEARNKLEAMPRFSQNKDEAFRLYALGITHEAIAYDATNLLAAREQLDRASKYYNQARVIRPDQLEFWWSEGRVSDLAWRYGRADQKTRAIEEARKQIAEGRITTTEASDIVQRAGTDATPPVAVGPGFGSLTNDSVISWVRAKVPERVIRSTIRRARTGGNYDLSYAGLADLNRAGVSKGVISEMRDTQRTERPSRSWIIMTVVMTVLPYVPVLFMRSGGARGVPAGRGCS